MWNNFEFEPMNLLAGWLQTFNPWDLQNLSCCSIDIGTVKISIYIVISFISIAINLLNKLHLYVDNDLVLGSYSGGKHWIWVLNLL